MKKLLLSTLAVLTTVSFACADTEADRTAAIKQTCLNNPDKFVWVELNQTCVPKHVCLHEKYKDYCFNNFQKFQVESADVAKMLVERYIKRWFTGVSYTIETPADPASVGDDFIQVHFSDGAYAEFRFDDYGETTIPYATLYALCEGVYLGKKGVNPSYCDNMMSKDDCEEWCLPEGVPEWEEADKSCFCRLPQYEVK